MRWTTTDPRSAGFQDRQGATINYVTAGAYTTLQKVGTGSTDWAEVSAVITAAPMAGCPTVSADPRSAGRAGSLDEIVLYYTAGAGVYLIKYGSGDTDWVPLPTAADVGPHTHPISDIIPGNDGDVATVVAGVSVWAPPASSSYSDSIFSGGQDGAIDFNGGAVTVATLAGSTYTLTQNVAATDINVAATYIVITAGYAMFWTGTLSGSGTIRNNGSAGTSIVTGAETGSGGAGAAGATLPAGAAGGGGAINSGSTATAGTGTSGAPVWNPVASGGAAGAATPGSGTAGTAGGIGKGGGSGGRGGGGFSVGAQAGTAGGAVSTINSDSAYTQCLVTGRTVTGTVFGGSTGGGGAPSPDSYNDFPAPHGADGAGGGGGGGWIVLAGDACTFTGTVEANGGAGGNGYSFNVAGAAGGIGGPGAGGGAGGTIIMFIGTGTLPTLDVSGGAGGTGGACTGGTVDNLTAPNGGAGGTGKVISRVLSA
jgi:hypothetical protein